MKMKGISPLIATVLILGFTVALAAVIMTWGTGFVKKMQETTEETAHKQMTCAIDVMLDIKKAQLIGDTIKLLIENSGNRDVNKFYVRIHGSDGVDSIKTTSGLEAFGIQSFEVNCDQTKVGAIDKVEVFPVIVYKGEEVVCSNTYDEEKVSLSKEGLILYLPLDGSTDDNSGLNNHGVNHGAVYTPDGKIGGAYDFYNNYIEVDWSDFTLNKYTIEFWMNPDVVSTGWKDIVSIQLTDENSRFHLDSSDNSIIWFKVNGAGTLDSNVVPTVGQWYHVVGTHDGTIAKVYIDGELKSSGSRGTSIFSTGVWLAGMIETYDGKLDEVRIYNRALSYSEIKSHYLGKY